MTANDNPVPMTIEAELNKRIRHLASRVMMHARYLTGGHCAISGLDYDAELTTENLKLLKNAVDDYDALIVQLAREATNKKEGA